MCEMCTNRTCALSIGELNPLLLYCTEPNFTAVCRSVDQSVRDPGDIRRAPHAMSDDRCQSNCHIRSQHLELVSRDSTDNSLESWFVHRHTGTAPLPSIVYTVQSTYAPGTAGHTRLACQLLVLRYTIRFTVQLRYRMTDNATTRQIRRLSTRLSSHAMQTSDMWATVLATHIRSMTQSAQHHSLHYVPYTKSMHTNLLECSRHLTNVPGARKWQHGICSNDLPESSSSDRTPQTSHEAEAMNTGPTQQASPRE
jgi:hypothetical protein